MSLESTLSKNQVVKLLNGIDLSNEYEVPDVQVYIMKNKSSNGNTRLQICIGLHDEIGKLIRTRKSITLDKNQVSTNKDINNQCLIIKTILINELSERIKEVNYSLFIPILKEYIQSKRGVLRDTSVDNYEFRANRIIEYFEKYDDITIEQITPSLVIKFIQYLQDEKHLSFRTVSDTHILLYGFMKEQVLKEIIKVNPCEHTSKMIKRTSRNNVNEEEFRYLDIEEFGKLSQWLETHKDKCYYRLKDLFELTMIYGFRKEEILALQWDCVDFNNKHIIIKRTRVKGRKVYDYENVKNKDSYRQYPLTSKAFDILQGRFMLTCFNKEEIKYVFYFSKNETPEQITKPYRPDYINKIMNKMIKAYKEETGTDLSWLTFHKLRHSCASILIQKGWSLEEIQHWLGHGDSETTKRIYVHFKKNWNDNKIECLDKIWNNHIDAM